MTGIRHDFKVLGGVLTYLREAAGRQEPGTCSDLNHRQEHIQSAATGIAM